MRSELVIEENANRKKDIAPYVIFGTMSSMNALKTHQSASNPGFTFWTIFKLFVKVASYSDGEVGYSANTDNKLASCPKVNARLHWMKVLMIDNGAHHQPYRCSDLTTGWCSLLLLALLHPNHYDCNWKWVSRKYMRFVPLEQSVKSNILATQSA